MILGWGLQQCPEQTKIPALRELSWLTHLRAFKTFSDIENNIKHGTSLLVQWELHAPSEEMQGVQVRPHMLHGVTKKKIKLIILTNVTMIWVYSSVVLIYAIVQLISRTFSFCRTDIVYPLTNSSLLSTLAPGPWPSIFSLNLTSLSTLYKWNHTHLSFSGWPVSLSIRSSRLCML